MACLVQVIFFAFLLVGNLEKGAGRQQRPDPDEDMSRPGTVLIRTVPGGPARDAGRFRLV
ncbi:MAG TPA: hypothetical protein DCR05_02425 [Alphaproteobacteria bacterium]|nr:hypothetical protein [Alphaproteobacteria bacterium]